MKTETDILITIQSDHTETYHIDTEMLFPVVQKWIENTMLSGTENTEAAQMSKLIKTAVKGVLIMYGDKILTMMLGKDHPKPSKKDDVVKWYTDMFARIALGYATKHQYIIAVEEGKHQGVSQKIIALHAFPVSE